MEPAPVTPSPKKPAVPPLLGAAADARQWLIVLRAHGWMATGLALVICTLVAWQQLGRPKLYAAQATLFLERGNRMQDLRPNADFPLDDLQIGTRLEQLRSPEMVARVAASLSPEEAARVLSAPSEGARPRPATALAGVVRGAVTVARKPGTMLLTVAAVHHDPRAAELLANRFAEEFVRYVFDRSLAGNDAALAFLRERAEEMRRKVETAESELQEYRQRFHLVSLEANQNIIVDNLKALNASSTAARVARLAAESRLAQAEDLLKRDVDAEQLASATGFESLADLAKRLADLQAKRAVLAQRYGRRHPAMLDSAREIEALQKLRAERVQSAIASLRDQVDKARAEERQLGEQLAQAEKEALQLDQVGVQYNTLRRAAETNRATYSQILTRLNEATVTAQLSSVNVRVSELATTPGAPFSPNLRRTLLLTLALGLALFLGYPFTMELLVGRVRSANDIEQFLDAEVLGEISDVRGGEATDRAQLFRLERDERGIEQFRALYSQYLLNSKIDPPKTILVTSTVPGEGKSFIAANLASIFVAHGRRVLLVDGDLRRPSQHRNFGLPNTAGLVEWLARGGSAEGDLLTDAALGVVAVSPGLHLLRAGGLSRKATELLATGRLGPLLEELQRRFDILIIDTPPAGVFPDAVAFAKFCHELVFVCRFNAVSRHAVRKVLDRLRQTDLELPGIVLNAMPAGFGHATYYYGYSYHQAKGYAKAYAHSGPQA
jgi:succinoglycan biosynthesis transport protein ExoP